MIYSLKEGGEKGVVMNRQLLLRQATSILRKDLGRIGKRGSRIHDNTAEDNVHRLRTIEGGICRSCVNLHIKFFHKDGKERIDLRCHRGFSPLELYRGTKFGKEAHCDGFLKIESDLLQTSKPTH